MVLVIAAGVAWSLRGSLLLLLLMSLLFVDLLHQVRHGILSALGETHQSCLGGLTRILGLAALTSTSSLLALPLAALRGLDEHVVLLRSSRI